MTKFVGLNFSIKLSKNWCFADDGEVYSFFNPSGSGVLQISVYIKDAGINNDEILDFIEIEYRENLKTTKYGDFDGFELIYIEDEANKFWRKLWLKNDELLLFITYNCNSEDSEYEITLIDDMLSSLERIRLNKK